MRSPRWQDRANFVLGLWLLISPWTLDYAGNLAALNAYIMGFGIVTVAVVSAYMPRAWQELVTTLIGVWLVLSPFVLRFSAMSTIALHTVLVGIVVTALAMWAMFACTRDERGRFRSHSV